MTREEIKEEIRQIILAKSDTPERVADYLTCEILSYLHSQGCVIRHGDGEADLWVEPLVGEI